MGESILAHRKDENSSKQVTFKNLVSSELEDTDMEGQQNDREPTVNWTSKSSAALEDPSTSYSPYLPPVLEEPSSSFSEGENFLCCGCIIVQLLLAAIH